MSCHPELDSGSIHLIGKSTVIDSGSESGMTVKKCKNYVILSDSEKSLTKNTCHPEALAEGSLTNVITPHLEIKNFGCYARSHVSKLREETSITVDTRGGHVYARYPEALVEGTTYVDMLPTHAKETSTIDEGVVANSSCPPLVQTGIDVSSAEVGSEATCVVPEICEFRGGQLFKRDSSVVTLPQNDCRKKKLAFTLAEVLITLGIIGVVAAMTIPNLMTAHQKKVTVTKLQKAISVLNQAYRLSYDELGDGEGGNKAAGFTMSPEEYFQTYWAPYLKVETYCTDYKMCGYDSDTPFKLPDGTVNSIDLFMENCIPFYTSDGFLYTIGTSPNGFGGDDRMELSGPLTLVDINGGKGPNTFGKDVFMLYRQNTGEKGVSVVAFGQGATTDEIKKSCSKTGNGRYCAEKIKRAGWQIDKSYPW